MSYDDLLALSTIDEVAHRIPLRVGQELSVDRGMITALFLAFSSILPKQAGGPFGSVVVKNNRLLAYGANHVTRYNDPTEHGEVNAIRQAITNKRSTAGATLITSCYPCPMCFSCAVENDISSIHYCSSPKDAFHHGGFLDQELWEDLERRVNPNLDSPENFEVQSRVIMPANTRHGILLIPLLQQICNQNGFEPKGISFKSNEPIALPLFEFMALRWAGIDLSHNVFIKPFDRNAVTFHHTKDYVKIGQNIFDLYRQIGQKYGQKK